MLEAMLGRTVVIDLRSPYVCLGLLHRLDEQHVELLDADLHDLRDSASTRENYVAASQVSGIKRNRKKVLLVRSDIVAYTLFDDMVDE
jgi:hypothetical protein